MLYSANSPGRSYAVLKHGFALDDNFSRMVFNIEGHLHILDRIHKVRIKNWLAKLKEETSNVVWKRNRNQHAQVLLQQLASGQLAEPFNGTPPEGRLQNLPQHILLQFCSPPRIPPDLCPLSGQGLCQTLDQYISRHSPRRRSPRRLPSPRRQAPAASSRGTPATSADSHTSAMGLSMHSIHGSASKGGGLGAALEEEQQGKGSGGYLDELHALVHKYETLSSTWRQPPVWTVAGQDVQTAADDDAELRGVLHRFEAETARLRQRAAALTGAEPSFTQEWTSPAPGWIIPPPLPGPPASPHSSAQDAATSTPASRITTQDLEAAAPLPTATASVAHAAAALWAAIPLHASSPADAEPAAPQTARATPTPSTNPVTAQPTPYTSHHLHNRAASPPTGLPASSQQHTATTSSPPLSFQASPFSTLPPSPNTNQPNAPRTTPITTSPFTSPSPPLHTSQLHPFPPQQTTLSELLAARQAPPADSTTSSYKSTTIAAPSTPTLLPQSPPRSLPSPSTPASSLHTEPTFAAMHPSPLQAPSPPPHTLASTCPPISTFFKLNTPSAALHPILPAHHPTPLYKAAPASPAPPTRHALPPSLTTKTLAESIAAQEGSGASRAIVQTLHIGAMGKAGNGGQAGGGQLLDDVQDVIACINRQHAERVQQLARPLAVDA